MNASLHARRRPVPLPFLSVLRFSGPDAARFLQGQVTHDTGLLAEGRTLLAACNTPQGRVVALLRLRQTSDGILALLPQELAMPLAASLRRFVLRAKVDVQVASDLHLAWVDGEPTAPEPDASGEEVASFDYAPGRRVVAVRGPARPAASGPAPWPSPATVENAWDAADIVAGLPQVGAATSGAFVPQMLNLDLLDAISFTKGCYTGQEIVARTQHLGRIKRRTLRYRIASGGAPSPLDALAVDDQKVAEVLMSATREGGVELLAVTSLDALGRTLRTADGREAVPEPLPYPVADR